MKTAILTVMLAVGMIPVGAVVEEPRTDLSEDCTKRFADGIPLKVTVTEKGSEFQVVVSNISSEFITLTKYPRGWSSHYLYGEEWKDEAGSIIPAATESLDHVVLRPKGKRDSPLSSWKVFKVSQTHDAATAAKFHISLGGYFPSVRDYVEFSVSIAVPQKPNRGEQGGAEQPATAPESKPQGNEKPKPESKGRSQ